MPNFKCLFNFKIHLVTNYKLVHIIQSLNIFYTINDEMSRTIKYFVYVSLS